MLFTSSGSYRLLPKTLTIDDAVNYYLNQVVSLRMNIHGKKIMINPNSVNCLFKPHNVQKGKYQAPRGRRLPWIVPVIEQTNIIKISRGCELYMAEIGIYYKIMGKWTLVPEYFCVIINKSNRKRYFKNAYPIKRNKYLNNLQLPDAY